MSGLRPHDPGGFALRAALRVAVVTPVAFALGLAIGDQAALFAIFGSLALSIFVDFGGPPAVRTVAYLTLTAVGCGLIAAGTLCSQSPVAAAVGMGVVGFAILFAGVVNGYLATATPAALLTFILPVMVPADAGAIGDRLLGWLVAAALAVPAALLVFPARPRDRLRTEIGRSCAAIADLVAQRTDATLDAAREALGAMHDTFASTPYRPSGPTGATGAAAEMVDELDWLTLAAGSELPGADALGPTPAERELREAAVDVLRASGALVAGESRTPPDVTALEQRRERVIEELLDQLASADSDGEDDARLWAALTRAWEVRIVSFGVRDVAARAQIVVPAHGSGPSWASYLRRQTIALAASRRLAAAHAGVQSVWFRNSVRGAVGLALAVLIAQLTSVQHGFWVVLGVLSVLRSNAAGTGRTIVEAFLGTLVGIAIGALLVLAIGNHRALLWAAMPLAAFLAAYAPRALSFAAAQAGFSVTVLVAFNLLVPTGWQVGLVRIEDVTIGFAISAGVGVLFWPQGARTLLRRALGAAFTADARYASAACMRMYAGAQASSSPASAQDGQDAERRLDAAFRQRLAERGSHNTGHMRAAARLTAGTARLRRTGGVIDHLWVMSGNAPRPHAATALVSDAWALGDWYVAFGEAIERDGTPPTARGADERTHVALLAGVREAMAARDRTAALVAVLTVWTGMHVDLLANMQPRMVEALVELE
jgi:uncharacterized membrane protein YccC